MKQPIRILGICLVIIVASLAAQAQGPNSPPLVVRFSGTDTFSFFNDCTGETVVGNIAFAGVTVFSTKFGKSRSGVHSRQSQQPLPECN